MFTMAEAEPSTEPSVVEEKSPRPWVRWVRSFLLAISVIPFAILLGFAALVLPSVWDDQRLDAAVAWVALDWRDRGLEAARTRLQYELDHQGIGAQVADSSCTFVEKDGFRVVNCAWDTTVHIPFTDRQFPLSFQSHAEVAPDGDLR